MSNTSNSSDMSDPSAEITGTRTVTTAMQDVLNAAQALRAAEGADDETLIALLAAYHRAGQRYAELGACSNCRSARSFGLGRFHDAFYTATCRRCGYVNVRALPTLGSPA